MSITKKTDSNNNPKEEFSKIYDRYIDSIYRFIFIKVSSAQIAEDICSETFVRGWQVFLKKRGRIKNFRAFLYRIAHNLIVDFYRKNGKIDIVSVDDKNILSDPKLTADHEAFLNSDIEELRKAISLLKDNYQNVIIWHYLDEMSIPEIAKLLHKREGTVRVMLSRALKALKSQLNHRNQV